MRKFTSLLGLTGLALVLACGGGEDAGMNEMDQTDESSRMREDGSMGRDSAMEEGMPDEMGDEDGGMMDDEGGMEEGMTEEDGTGGDGMGGGV